MRPGPREIESMANTQPKTRGARVQAREDSIIEAAATLFASRGFDEVTVGEIAKRAGVAEGTVYLYFESKAALARAVLIDFYDRLTAQAALGVRKIRDTRARFDFLAEHHIANVIEHNRILFGMAHTRSGEGADDHYRLNRAYVAVFDDVVREGVDRGDIQPGVPLWLLRDVFYGSLEYAARTTLIHGRSRSAKSAVAGLMQILESGALASGHAQQSAESAPAEELVTRLERIADRLETATPTET
jgi:TetR/AcrR family fatty acid metabolism transcriptional regulator